MLKGSPGSLVNSKTTTAWKYPLQAVRHRTRTGYVPPARRRGESWVPRPLQRGRARGGGRGRTGVQQQGLALRRPLLVREGELPGRLARLAPPQRHRVGPAVLHQHGDRPGLAGHHREADVPVALVVLGDDLHPVLPTDELSPAGRGGQAVPARAGVPRAVPGQAWAGCCRSYHFLARPCGACGRELGCWPEADVDANASAFVLGLQYWSAITTRLFSCEEPPASAWPQGPAGGSQGTSPGGCRSRCAAPARAPSPA